MATTYILLEKVRQDRARLRVPLLGERGAVAPSLLYYEVANALCRYERAGELAGDEVQQGSTRLLPCRVRLAGEPALHVEAVLMARRLGLAAAYDAHYLALAERLGAEFWTGDANLVRKLGGALPWVHCVLDDR